MTPTQIERTQNALIDVEAAIDRAETRLEKLTTDLGSALADHRVGERGADKRAASLSMDAGKARSELSALQSEERALKARLATLEQEARAEQSVHAASHANEYIARLESTEVEYAAVMTKAIDVVQRMQAMDQEFKLLNQQLGTLGVEKPAGLRPPRPAGRLMNVTTVIEGVPAVKRWLSTGGPHSAPYTNLITPWEKNRGAA